jgi:thiol-disulfide isomerase/thioredoxin
MKNLIIILILFLPIFANSYSQEPGSTLTNDVDGKPMLTGYLKSNEFLKEPFSKWYETGFESYSPNKNILQHLKENNIIHFNFVIVIGTWCPDTHKYVPQMMKVLEEASVPGEKIKIIGVDRYKKAEGIDLTEYSIERIPTMIVFLDGTEIGRIVERPRGSVEKELQRIMGNW